MAVRADDLQPDKPLPFDVYIENKEVKCRQAGYSVPEGQRKAEFEVSLEEEYWSDYALGLYFYDDVFDEIEITKRTQHSAIFVDQKKTKHPTAIRFGIDLVPLRDDVTIVLALDPIIVND